MTLEEPGLRRIVADNPGPFTLDGTRTFIVGRRRVAVVDPGPHVAAHVNALASLLQGAESVLILLTHGHGDHADSAAPLARLISAPVLGAGPVQRTLQDGEEVETDAGKLVAVHTPGHSKEHLCYHWPGRGALFAGDLLLGEGDTTWVGGYPECVGDYFASLARVRRLGLRRVYPAHGPPIEDVPEALVRFEAHKRARIAQVEAVLRERPDARREEILERIYGKSMPPSLQAAALQSLDALLEYVRDAKP